MKKYYKEKLRHSEHRADATDMELERVNRDNSELKEFIKDLEAKITELKAQNEPSESTSA